METKADSSDYYKTKIEINTFKETLHWTKLNKQGTLYSRLLQ